MPSYWRGRKHIRSAKALLGPRFHDLLRKGDLEATLSSENDADSNVLVWLAAVAKGPDRNPDILAHVEVLLALASVHTTLLRMVNVLYDLMDNPDHLHELRAEIEAVRQHKWQPSSYSSLQKLDSVLQESQRISPPTNLGMKRLFRTDYTFSTGLHIPKATYVCMPTFAIENDEAHTSRPEVYDGFRSYNMRQREGESDQHQFTSTKPTVLNFGYGKSACPGRFFAGLVLKMLFVKLLTEYDFKFLPGAGKPSNIQMHEFVFPRRQNKVLVRRRQGQTAPF